MATTRIADAIVPENFSNYLVEDTKELAEFVTSGLIASSPALHGFILGGGKTQTIPFWRDLPNGNGANTASDDPSVIGVPDKLQAASQVAHRIVRTKGWSTMDLTAELAGTDPGQRIRERVAPWWTRQFQREIIAVLAGVKADNVANDNSDATYNAGATGNNAVTEANLFSGKHLIRAAQTAGDAKGQFSIMIVHSVIEARMQELQLIVYVQEKNNNDAFERVARYGKYRVIVDDGATVTAIMSGETVLRYEYTTILAAPGSVMWEEKVLPMATEVERFAKIGNGMGGEELWTRRAYVVHPAGMTFTLTSFAGNFPFPSPAELALGTSWNRVTSERKQLPFAFLVTNG